MARAQRSAAAHGQKSIASLFKGSAKSESDADTASGLSDSEVSEPEEEAKKPTAVASKSSAPDASDLPPIHNIPAIFSDLVARASQIKVVAQHLQGRKMRVATMCSGTESPLLALDLIRRSILQHYDVNLECEHVFSCEIEPFKQAYIERNFQPPLLFRDVCELGDTHAYASTTAYGSLAPVPGDVDILIAGTSCVDYSNLNNENQDIDANGESGRTFRGMMSWVKNHRPPLVILENVCSAPWERVVEYFEKNKYSSQFLRVDTKDFYIPHTRTRVYLLAVDRRNSDLPDEWAKLLNKLKRPASSTLDAFLLPSDDPRIHQAREKLVSESYNAVDRRRGRTDWGRCESRHQRARLEEELGSKRPLTSWDEGGFCKLPDFAWNDWGVGQVERVWDLMDISLLRSAKKGVDPSYKTQVWNLSQNVDRTIGSNKVGICTCLTPAMIPYITNRGGPMVGIEALSMQGLPVDELLLTRETEDQLADLAGNAMSTTVVGACIMAALIVGRKLLKEGNDTSTYESRDNMSMDVDRDEVRDDSMDVDQALDDIAIEDRVSGVDQLVDQPLDLASTAAVPLVTLLDKAVKSARLCECEGRKDITDRQVNRCKDCGSSSCVKCGGRPEHNPEPIDVQANPRMPPTAFAKELKSTLPMSVSLSNVSQALLDSLKEASGVSIPSERWSSWCEAVLRVSQHELRFVEPKRQDIWVATYQSPVAYLELLLLPQQPEWRLFAKPEESEPANSELRRLLETPVGRMACRGGLCAGRWDFALPHTTSVRIMISGSEPVPSWEQKLGLQGDEFRDKMVNSRLEISVPQEDMVHFDRDISGVYTLLDKCGTANSALHKKMSDERDSHLPPLFLFLDPTRCGDPADDCFVISISKRRYEYGETRPLVCKFDSEWRQSDTVEEQSIECHIPQRWVESPETRLTVSSIIIKSIHVKAYASNQPVAGHEAHFAVPGDHLNVSISNDACSSANALLVCRVPLLDQAGPEWPRGTWQEVDKVHERVTFKALAWLIERIRNVGDHFGHWQDAEIVCDHVNCERCAPTAPDLRWMKNKNRIVAIEDTAQAGEYERRLKRRPAPFVTQLKLEKSGVGVIRIGVNITSLMHRAMSRLPSAGRTGEIKTSWRLTTDFLPAAKIDLPKFKLSSNRHDVRHAQPPSFVIDLRPEQLRSLTWMLVQEEPDAPPFIEEEISDAILEPLGWRAEGRAQRPVRVRGGVLADEVGYGKTAITLGLIDCTSKSVEDEFKKMEGMKGKIPVKATLVVVPPHLTRQWGSEVKKFTGKRFKVIILMTATSMNSLTIEDVQEADIVVVASNLFQSNVYLGNLEIFAGGGSLPVHEGRYFNARLETVLASLRGQVDRLREEGAQAVIKKINEGRKLGMRFIFSVLLLYAKSFVLDEDEGNFLLSAKRLKGKTSRQAVEVVEDAAKPKPKPEPSETKNSRTRMIMEVVIPPLPKLRKKEVEGPWELGSTAVKKDWTKMQAPPLEMFHFSRKVVDEYTYLDGKIHSMVTNITAERHWVLSGTPPIHDFRALKTISAFLNLHLGVDDDGEGQSVQVKKRRKEETAVEKFHSFREVHSLEWHAHRHQIGQAFLDQFVRQNIAEIDEILSSEGIRKVDLPAAERAIYLELEHHLRALDMTVKRSRKSESDREKRVAQALGESSTAEEALLKRCSHFELDSSDKENAMKACEVIVRERCAQLDDCKTELEKMILEALKMEKKIGKMEIESLFREYVRVTRNEGVGDEDATEQTRTLLDQANVAAPLRTITNKQVDARGKGKSKDDDLPESIKQLIWEHREKTHVIRRLTKELVGRVRSLRYFTAVRDLQKQADVAPVVSCPSCRRDQVPIEEVAVLSSCGHMGCIACVTEHAEREECVYAASGACKAAARVLNVVKGDTLGVDDEQRDGQGKHYGLKLEKVIYLVKKEIPKEERVLVFVQFPDLMKKVAEALAANDVKFLEIRGTAVQKSKSLEQFQTNSKERVLLLNVMDESASGANLTSANHAVFLSPLLAATQEIYDACETQAIGRLRRYGQTKLVNIYRFLSTNTIDVETYEQRAKVKI
ncbi:uncharacterized protein LAESUDRAFT_642051 [Laetiporus sulphureus 93-53]|uniref:Helicase ATP-binding domain-containing protein n=1 Tax=Laetiporus sulphureus 93-53 TaxID=1314785 RepID=A0A165H7Q4_9APHY|nr:uncharacterized protein LAESUDRAFT_642051 [Laetiporus sulphureus 93-53]KZT11359.1 hypothetical protein LAESUDRAFT_642051 [Laetiporus sulphureus 93-53]